MMKKETGVTKDEYFRLHREYVRSYQALGHKLHNAQGREREFINSMMVLIELWFMNEKQRIIDGYHPSDR